MKLDRTCYKCGTDFVLKPTQKSSNICPQCKREYQKGIENKKSKVALEGYKEPYPYDEKAKMHRFSKIRKHLDKVEKREDWQQFFKEQLYKLETDDIAVLKWIYDRRGHNETQEMIENPHKKDKESYEDTRTTHNNNKSWFD
jgi:PHP family Zn ribbon phosphoesterase